ncbi:unnamed protein product [Candida verbasci]|uniref:12 kDa heat shock protein n=1 Tax=Candida verbasci TaxID=1227364 RepID=A0A9W4TZG5_9ASCO|nr:unnamed protein product [Candida verbasci]
MSDAGRKNVSDKIGEGLKPDSEKSYLEKGKEQVTDSLDKFAANTTPDNQKSFSQTISDDVQKGHDDAKSAVKQDAQAAEGQGSSLAETAQEYINVAKEKASEAAEYVSGVVGGATEGAKTGAETSKK